MSAPRRFLAAVTLDATGTLLHAPRLGAIYAEVLARHGVVAAEREVLAAIRNVWRELACLAHPARDRFADGAPAYWQRFVARVAQHLGHDQGVGPFAAAELYDRFASPDSWQLYPEVPEALAALRGAGLRLAVVSNWDPRLHGILAGLGLAERLETVVLSSEVGVEKPHRRIFETALGRLGLPPSRVLHVGDARLEDLEGAQAVGMQALLLARQGGGDVADLAAVVRRVLG